MPLSNKQIRHLRKLAHHLKPVVIIGGAGLNENVLAEIDGALSHHELIKVRVNAEDKAARQALVAKISAETHAEHVQSIGHVASFFRRNPDKPKVDPGAP